MAEILKLLFERNSKGKRMTGSSPDKVIRTVLTPTFVISTPLALKVGATESATVALTLPVNVAEFCAATLAEAINDTAKSVKI